MIFVGEIREGGRCARSETCRELGWNSERIDDEEELSPSAPDNVDKCLRRTETSSDLE